MDSTALTIQTLLHRLAHDLEGAARIARDAALATQGTGNNNLAVGTLLEAEDRLRYALPIFETIMAIHSRGCAVAT